MRGDDVGKHAMFGNWLLAAKEAKKPIEWEWFVRKNYLDGNHWIRWNPTTKSVEQVGSGNQFRTTINEIYRITRAIRTYVTKHDPKWEIMAQDLSQRVFEKAEGSEKFLDLYYIQEQVKKKLKETVYDALYASVGHFWYWWDGKDQWLRCINVDPFDFLPDPTAKDTMEYSDAKFVARAYTKKAEELRQDPRFKNKGDIVADNILAASDMKVALLQLTAGVNDNAWTDNKDLETTMCFEIYYRVNADNDKGGRINHAIITATAILIDESTRFVDMPARTYHTDTETNKQYTQGWVKNLIGPQKIIDQNESTTLEYNHIFGKGRYVTEKASGVNVIINKNGQIITKNRGTYFEQLQALPQTSTVENQTIRASRYLENLGAAHDAFVGRMPTGANSGIAIETLLAGEENNLADLRDNLHIFMISNAHFILRSFARSRMKYLLVSTQKPDKSEPDFYAMVGNQSPIKTKKVEIVYGGEKKTVDVQRIMEENNIRVTIGTWLGTGKNDSQNRLLEFAKAGLIDTQTVLEFFNAPNIPEVMKRLKQAAEDKARLAAATANAPGTVPAIEPPGGAGAGPATGNAGAVTPQGGATAPAQ